MKLAEALPTVRAEIAEHRRLAEMHKTRYNSLKPSAAPILRRLERVDMERHTKQADALECLVVSAS